MLTVELDELETDYGPIELSAAVATDLGETGLVNVLPAGAPGMWKLSAAAVGAVQIGDVLVSVRPKAKVGVSQLLFLLGYAKDPGFRPEDVDGIDDVDLWAALGESLARHGERALARGALHGYVHFEDSLRTVRGRIRISDQISRHPGMLLPLEVAYDEHTIDIPENRILRTAIRMVSELPRLAENVRARLIHLDAKLDGVVPLRLGRRLPKWSPSRLNAHYAPALRLAAVILRNAAAESGRGGVRVASFVVNMAKVFEDFVSIALTEALSRHPGSTKAQYPAFLDEEESRGNNQRISMNVDIVHELGGHPAVVYDAKYKAASGGGAYPNADHYQMLAYCTALDVEVAWLIYAGTGQTRSRNVRNTEVTIVEYPIDLRRPPREVLTTIDVLVSKSIKTAIGSLMSIVSPPC